MAIQFNLAADHPENNTGFEFQEAYGIVPHYSGDRHYVTFNLTVQANATAREQLKQPVAFFNFTVDIASIDSQEGSTQLERIYNYIKTLPDFEGATNV